MTEQITLEKALELVSFYQGLDGIWYVDDVHGDIIGNVDGDICGTVQGFCNTVKGNCNTVEGNVLGDINGSVEGTINGRLWQYIETPKEKFMRLLNETNNLELIATFNQLEDN